MVSQIGAGFEFAMHISGCKPATRQMAAIGRQNGVVLIIGLFENDGHVLGVVTDVSPISISTTLFGGRCCLLCNAQSRSKLGSKDGSDFAKSTFARKS